MKMKKPEILVVCGAGLGSSFACEMSVEEVLNEENIETKLSHSDISTASSSNADIIITGSNFASQFKQYDIQAEIIYLQRMVDKNEIREKLMPVLEKIKQ